MYQRPPSLAAVEKLKDRARKREAKRAVQYFRITAHLALQTLTKSCLYLIIFNKALTD